jgi:hypothetical protein
VGNVPYSGLAKSWTHQILWLALDIAPDRFLYSEEFESLLLRQKLALLSESTENV